MNITRYDLRYYPMAKDGYYPSSVYVMTYDDGSARLFRRDRGMSAWKIYKNFDEAAAVIKKMTEDNLYVLADIPDVDDPWTYYSEQDNHVAVRYDYTMMGSDQRRKIADCDRWHRQAGIILKDHYYKSTDLFDPSKAEARRIKEKARIDAMPCPF